MPGAVLWLHGLGDSGTGGWSGAFAEVSNSRPGTIFQFPTAPEALVSCNGSRTTAWFDIESMPVVCSEPEPPPGIEDSVRRVHEMLDDIVKGGVKAKYIVLGGFSQGGTMSLLAGLSYPEKLGGIISISGWCARRADVSTWISDAGKNTPVLMCFGDGDPVISYSITKMSSELLHEVLGEGLEILSDIRGTHMPVLDGPEMTRVFRFMTRHLPKTPPKKAAAKAAEAESGLAAA